MSTRAKYILACALGLLWIIALVMRWLGEAEPQQAPLRFKIGQRPSQTATAKKSFDDFDVKLVNISNRESSLAPRKNIFAMMERQKNAALIKKTVPQVPAAAMPPPPSPPVVTAPPPPTPPQPTPEELAALAARQQREFLIRQTREQIAQYRYLGYVNREGHHQAFIGKGSEIHIVDEGDKLEGKFLVTAIDANSVILREGQTNLEGRIELKKNQAVGPS